MGVGLVLLVIGLGLWLGGRWLVRVGDRIEREATEEERRRR